LPLQVEDGSTELLNALVLRDYEPFVDFFNVDLRFLWACVADALRREILDAHPVSIKVGARQLQTDDLPIVIDLGNPQLALAPITVAISPTTGASG
jgi:hypothetical protein